MKVLSTRQLSSLISLSFKTVGIVMIIGALIDIVVVPLPFQFQETQWLFDFTTLIVDRGIIPLVGIALFLAGNWVDSLAGNPIQIAASWRSIQFWILILACVLSLIYVLATVFHVSSVTQRQAQRLDEIAEQFVQDEQRLDQQIEATLGQRRQGIQQLLENPELRDQAVSQGAISPEDAQRLSQFEQDPEQLEAFLTELNEQAAAAREEQQAELGARREEEISRARTNARKSLFRIGLSGVLLAIGYAIIGWTGLRQHVKGAS